MYRFNRDELRCGDRATAFIDERAIRFQEVDAAGIIFYPRILEMFHDAYAAFLGFAGAPLPEVMERHEWLAPVRHAEADYFKPLRFGDAVRVAICRAHVAETEATLGYCVTRGDEICVVGQVVHTFVERATFKRTPIPPEVRRALLRIESGA